MESPDATMDSLDTAGRHIEHTETSTPTESSTAHKPRRTSPRSETPRSETPRARRRAMTDDNLPAANRAACTQQQPHTAQEQTSVPEPIAAIGHSHGAGDTPLASYLDAPAIKRAMDSIDAGIEPLLDAVGKIARAMDRQSRAMREQSLAIRLRKRVLTFEEACLYLDLSESHLYKLTADGTVPHSKPNGKKLYFKRDELDAWLMSRPVKTQAELEREAATYCMRHERGPESRRRRA